MQNHLNDFHSSAQFKINSQKFEQAIHDMNVHSSFPSPALHPIPEVAGLQLFSGYICSYCPLSFGTQLSIKKHHREAHKNVSLPSSWQQHSLQRFSSTKGSARSFFRVIPQQNLEPLSTISTIAKSIRASMAPLISIEHVPANARVISPWLLTTKWHEHVAGHSASHLCALASPPSLSEFPGLSNAVNLYLAKALDLLPSTPELVLQILNSPDPSKTYVPFLFLIYSYNLILFYDP